ncbi:MAG: molecular chaperone [Betaproteobacteria bacterium]
MADSDVKRIAARADLCRLLAACYYQPGPEFVEERVFESLRTAAAEVDCDMAVAAKAMGEDFDAQPLEELQVDYTRLFLNPTGAVAAPYESAWLAGRDPMKVDEVTRSVLDSYRQGGYDVDLSFRDLPDHIAAELEFLYGLIFREARAAASGNDAERAEAIERRHRFVEQHLGRWIVPFTAALRSGGETALYRTLADLTERFVRSEAK